MLTGSVGRLRDTVENPLREAASELRHAVADLFGMPDPNELILVPGICNALEILLSRLGCKTLLVTEEEYYDEDTSPLPGTIRCSAGRVLQEMELNSPDAILMSAVTWKGNVLPVKDTFKAIFTQRRSSIPLLVADYSHAGAIGFPQVDFPVDLVCGDLGKWIVPPVQERNLAFLWAPGRDLRKRVQQVFCKYYLATCDPTAQRLCRWIEPGSLLETAGIYSEQKVSKKLLVERYRRNRKLTREVAQLLTIVDSGTCILWSDTPVTPPKDERLLVWNTGGGARIICRADLDMKSDAV